MSELNLDKFVQIYGKNNYKIKKLKGHSLSVYLHQSLTVLQL